MTSSVCCALLFNTSTRVDVGVWVIVMVMHLAIVNNEWCQPFLFVSVTKVNVA
jgi:hypothetical protein